MRCKAVMSQRWSADHIDLLVNLNYSPVRTEAGGDSYLLTTRKSDEVAWPYSVVVTHLFLRQIPGVRFSVGL